MKLVTVSTLFDVKYGVNLELNRLISDPNGINFVSRSAKNNGITGKVKQLPNITPIESGVLTVAGGGSVLETFVQMEPFYSGRDLYYLKPLIELTLEEKLYYCMCIRANKYRFSYGRQANRTLKAIQIPATTEIPDWVHEVFEETAKEWSVYLSGLIKPVPTSTKNSLVMVKHLESNE